MKRLCTKVNADWSEKIRAWRYQGLPQFAVFRTICYREGSSYLFTYVGKIMTTTIRIPVAMLLTPDALFDELNAERRKDINEFTRLHATNDDNLNNVSING